MPRLGELLIASKVIDGDQLERALRAQVMWGGRLGTNLVELRLVDLDTLARTLGLQHMMPAALERHFEAADRALQQRLDPALADGWSVVPLVHLDGGKLAFASIGPLSAITRGELARIFGVEPASLVVAVAPEQRVRYQIERVYGIPRETRFLRARGQDPGALAGFEQVDVFDDGSDVEIPIEIGEEISDASEAEAEAAAFGDVSTEDLSSLIENAIATFTAPPDDERGEDRRGYVRTLDEPPDSGAALGRIAIRRVQSGKLPLIEASAGPANTLKDATRAIRRSAHRDRAADLVMDTLERFAPSCAAAVIVVVRGQIAIGWKHFARTGEVASELAVPVDQPGLLRTVIETAGPTRAAAGDLGAIDHKLLAALGGNDCDLVVVPVPIAGRVMCMLAAAVTPGQAIQEIEAVAVAASTAFQRLLRDASR